MHPLAATSSHPKERFDQMSMKTFAFKNRLFLIYTAVIAVVVVLFSAVLIVTIWRTNQQMELYHQKEIYQKNLAEIENILWQMDRLAAQVVSNNEILGVFIPLASDGDPGNYFDANLMDVIRISSLLSSINGTDNYAERISVFNGHGDYVSAGSLYETTDSITEALDGDYYATMQEKVMRLGSEGLLVDFHEDTWSSISNLQLMSLYRTLSSYTNTVYGLVDIQVSTDAFAEYPFWQNGETEYFLISGDGHIVYPFVEMDDTEPLFTDVIASLAEDDQGDGVMLRKRVGTRDVILMGAHVTPSDWLFVRILPVSILMLPYIRSLVTIIFACAVMLCCLVLVMYYLSNRIAKPLQLFTNTVANVNLQNMQAAIQNMNIPYAMTELNALQMSFYKMLTRLDKSLSMEIQAHMRALQTQMNPHFLFNMLSVIIESSEESGDHRTVSMCLKLSAMLRYIADFNGDYASLPDELAHARNYLDLMRDRYEDMFSYDITTDGNLDKVMVPKVIIQPLVENCFSHGFRDCRPPWRINIDANVDPNGWKLRITDNGAGITDETIRLIHEKVDVYRSDVATNYKNLKLGGMGLVNTLLRLSLSQGGQIDFSIACNPDGRGTIVFIGGNLDHSRADS